MSEDLPDLVTKFKADLGELIANIAEAKAAVKDFGSTSSKAGTDASKGMKDAEKSGDDLAKSIQQNSKDGQSAFKALTTTIDQYKAKVKDLQAQITSGGGNSSTSLFGDLSKAKSDLSSLTKMAEDVAPGFSKVGSDAGSGFWSSFTSSVASGMENFGGLFGLSGPVGIGILAGLAAVLPVAVTSVIAALNGAVLAGLGAGVIAVGFMQAAKDPRVAAALTGLKTTISSTLASSTTSFIGPALAGIGDLKADFLSLGPGLKSTFAALAPAVKPLIDGLGGFITNLLPGLESGLKAAEPILESLATQLPWLGTQVGNMFDRFGQGAAGAKAGLQTLITGLGELADFIGVVFRDSSGFFLAFNQELVHVVNGVSDVIGWLGKIPGNGALKTAAAQAHDYANSVQGFIDQAKTGPAAIGPLDASISELGIDAGLTATQLQAMTKALDDQINSIQSAANADLGAAQAQLAFADGVKKGSKNWDESTKVGQANLSLLYAWDGALARANDTKLKNNTLTLAGAQAYLKEETGLYNSAKAAGANATALAPVSAELSAINSYIAQLKNKTIEVNVKTHYTSSGTPPTLAGRYTATPGAQGLVMSYAQGGVSTYAHNAVASFAGAGIYSGGGTASLIKFAEPQTGGEAYIPRFGDRNRQMATAATALNWLTADTNGTSSTTTITHNYAGTGGGQTVHITMPVVLGGKTMATLQRTLVVPSQRTRQRGTTSGL